jgi:VWFA-related protein
MERTACILAATLAFALGLYGQQAPVPSAPEPIEDSNVTFKSDVNLVRVDVQVLSSTNQPITTLRREDFRLTDNGQVREISSLSREAVPMDIVLLLDVSGSMRPHVERVASAAHQALTVLGNKDRVGIMTFDRTSRVILPFSGNHDDVVRGFEELLNREDFNGGTHIQRGMSDAIRYLKQNARPGTRRAVVILTDDVSEFAVDEFRIGRDLEDANATLSALIAPDAMGHRQQIPTTSRTGGGGGMGGMTLPDIIFGRRMPGAGGQRMPGGVTIGRGSHMHSGATPRIARASGGDSMDVANASSLEDTLERLRQSYALYFNAADASGGQQRNIDIRLAGSAASRHPNAQLIYRGSYNAVEGATTSAPDTGVGDIPTAPPTVSTNDDPAPRMKRRPAVNEPGSNGGWRKAESIPPQQQEEPAPEPTPAPAAKAPAAAPQPTEPAPQQSGGFRRIKPGEKP